MIPHKIIAQSVNIKLPCSDKKTTHNRTSSWQNYLQFPVIT